MCVASSDSCSIDRPQQHTENLFTLEESARIDRFEVRDGSGTVLWSLASATPIAVKVVRYAAIPPGFTQSVPNDGRTPRPLVDGERVTILARTNTHRFKHEGVAKGAAEFLAGVSTFTPISAPRPPPGPPSPTAVPLP